MSEIKFGKNIHEYHILTNEKLHDKKVNKNKTIYPRKRCEECKMETTFWSTGYSGFDVNGVYHETPRIGPHNRCENKQCRLFMNEWEVIGIKCISCGDMKKRTSLSFDKYTLCEHCDICLCRRCKKPIYINQFMYNKIGDLCYDCYFYDKSKNNSLFNICYEELFGVDLYYPKDEFKFKDPDFITGKRAFNYVSFFGRLERKSKSQFDNEQEWVEYWEKIKKFE